MTSKVAPHGLLAKLFHWGFIGIFLYALSKQLTRSIHLAMYGSIGMIAVSVLIFRRRIEPDLRQLATRSQ
jgi:cytochrome b